METCNHCKKSNIKKYSKSGQFYKCSDCGYIGAYPRKEPKPKQIKEVQETTCADDYLNYLESRW